MLTLKIYLAGLHETRLHMQMHEQYITAQVQELAKMRNLEVSVKYTNDWTREGEHTLVQDRAIKDYQGIDDCDIFISFSPSGLGTASEMSYAIARDKMCIHLIPEEYYDGGNTDILPLGLYKAVTGVGGLNEALANKRPIMVMDLTWFSYALQQLAREVV